MPTSLLLARLAHVVHRRRLLVIGIWIGLTIFGLFSAAQVSNRWLQQFSIPGYSAYEANQRALKTFGTGEQAPLVAVYTAPGRDVTTLPGIKQSVTAVEAANPGGRSSSFFSTGGNKAYVSHDGHTMFVELYPPGQPGFSANVPIDQTRAALQKTAPAGVAVHLTGRDALQVAEGGAGGPSILVEFAIGALGALVILLFVFGTLPAVAMPLAVAIASILNTFTLIWALTYITDVSIIVQFLVALVGLGVAIDYSLLMIFRYRDELASGQTPEDALVETMTHAGRSVIVSGSTVAIGLLSLVLLPIPFIRSVGIGGMLIPAVSVIAAITLLPALFSVLGHRINSARVMPKRFVEAGGHNEAGFWYRWSQVVVKRPAAIAAIGLAIVAVLIAYGIQLNPSQAELKYLPAKGDAKNGLTALTAAQISPGVLQPFVVLIEHSSNPRVAGTVADKLAQTPGIAGAAAPAGWQKGTSSLAEAFATDDGSAKPVRSTISNIQHTVLPDLESSLDTTGASPPKLTLSGVSPEDRDFVHAVYGNFGYVLLFVVVLTFILLMRAFRSVILPLKAVVLNLVSLGAAYGIIVFIFQQGHGSQPIWGVHATNSIIAWIPLMIFAFLYGLSMDYEVFMLTRMREAYDETGNTEQAVSLGLARTGKLVTSAALVLMFAFFVLSLGPSVDIKQFGIGLAAGIIFDATVIRALLVPSLMLLLGRWNWWLPKWPARILRVRPSPLEPSAAKSGA